MGNTFKLRFILRKPKQYESGPQPIYMRVTLDGKRAEMSIQRECDPLLWDEKAGRTTSTKENGRLLNAHLEGLITKAYNNQTDLIQNQMSVTAQAIVNRVAGKPDNARMLVAIFENHNKEMGQLVNREYAPATLNRFETTLMHIVSFMQKKYGITDIDITKLKHEFVTDLNFYLRTERNCNNNSAVKYITNFRKIIRICIANGWLIRDPFINFKVKVKEVERTFLSEEELQSMHDKFFVIDRLNQVKDIFLFSCYTGRPSAQVRN